MPTILNFDDQDEQDVDRRSLLKESGHLSRSEVLLDEQLEIAARTRERLAEQRSTFSALRQRLDVTTNQFGAINSLIKRINIKKRKDTIVVAIVFSLCLGLLLYKLMV